MECIGVLKIPSTGFKIKKKSDAELFLNEVFCSGTLVVDVSKWFRIVIQKTKEGKISVSFNADKGNVFSPSLEVPEDRQTAFIYEYRKYINRECLKR